MSEVVSGIPKGSVLGPILFLLLINDIVSTFCSYTPAKSFDDDLTFDSIHNNDDNIPNIQQSIDRLVHLS
jgi:mannose/fructose/N-acetylgalactosamine-specific phosphotransferase system component IID